MELLHAAVALLASMVFVLAGMVGWLYWQQTRLFQNMNSVLMAIGDITHAMDNSVPAEPEPEAQPKPTPVPVEEEDEDDRASVEETAAEVVDGPPAPIDVDALQGKTKKELQDMLSKRGLPFSKTDAKPTLISLLKATA
jgi:beta-lactam-binding protein with PASTA domain